jgi:hypothetical protein
LSRRMQHNRFERFDMEMQQVDHVKTGIGDPPYEMLQKTKCDV